MNARPKQLHGRLFPRGEFHGHELIPLLYAEADPGPAIATAAFERLAAGIETQIAKAGRIDALLIDLHGAMVIEADEDGDAALLERLRITIGPDIPIVVTFDLHGNISPRTLAACDGAVAYRTYPHVDMTRTGERAADLLQRVLDGGKLTVAHRFLPFMMPLNRQATISPPTADLYAELELIEAEGDVASMSLMLSFQMADVAYPVPSIFAYADQHAAAQKAVDRLYDAVILREADYSFDYQDPAHAAAIAASYSGPRPLVLADAQDSVGGGGSSDTMFLVKALIAAGVKGVVVGIIWDPVSAAQAHSLGIGESQEFSIGGRSVAGDSPLQARFTVKKLANKPALMRGPMLDGTSVELGRCALLEGSGVEIIVVEERAQCLDQGFFHHLGIDPATRDVILIKDAVHFRSDFDQITGRLVDVVAPGTDIMDFSTIPYSHLAIAARFNAQPICVS